MSTMEWSDFSTVVYMLFYVVLHKFCLHSFLFASFDHKISELVVHARFSLGLCNPVTRADTYWEDKWISISTIVFKFKAVSKKNKLAYPILTQSINLYKATNLHY